MNEPVNIIPIADPWEGVLASHNHTNDECPHTISFFVPTGPITLMFSLDMSDETLGSLIDSLQMARSIAKTCNGHENCN
jgi:hypothetical protein